MDGGWKPEPVPAQQICYLLAEYQKPGTNQSQILAQLELFKNHKDFNNYLAAILGWGDELPVEVRQSAGLLLKNTLKDGWAAGTTSDDHRTYIKAALLRVLDSPHKALRHTVGTNIAGIVGMSGLASWPELLIKLVSCLESSDPSALEGALDALYKICEEVPYQVEADIAGLAGGKPSGVLVPRLLHLFGSPWEDAKHLSVSTLNLLAASMPTALAENIETYMKGLFELARDKSTSVRKAVCTGLVQLLHLQPERLSPHMHEIIEYMLESTQDGDEGVALESCEFWSAFCEAAVSPDVLRPFLPRLVPVLLRNMVYDEYDEEVADAEAAEEAAPGQEDSEQEIKPFISRNAVRGMEEDEDPEGDEVNKWNLRKCSAAGLDVLSTVFGEELLPIVTPIVQQRLQDPMGDWRARESAILALGAISIGCASGLVPYLAEMVNMLLPHLADARPLVRSITCWALSRYARWIVERSGEPTGGAQQMDAVLQGLLRHVLDHNKHVQEAACSALATLEEEAGPDILSRPTYMQPILETLAVACRQYGRRNMRILYDALSTLADVVRGALADKAALNTFLPPLVDKWSSVADYDRELLPLLECFTSIAQALGPAFEEYAAPTFERCIRVISLQLEARLIAERGGVPPVPHDRNFVICALDLISGLAEGLGASIESLVVQSTLREMLLLCCNDTSPDVRQSAFALVGDLSKACAAHLQPALKDIVSLAVANLAGSSISHENMSACNNACWALGELAIKSRPEELSVLAVPIVERLIPILAAPMGAMPRSLVENSAITLGRVAWMCPEPMAPHLDKFVGIWCASLRTIRDDVEKEHAFLGLCAMLRLNPQGVLSSFTPLCEAVVSWRTIRCEGLCNEITQIMQLYKQHLSTIGQWDAALAQLSPPVRDKLLIMCSLI